MTEEELERRRPDEVALARERAAVLGGGATFSHVPNFEDDCCGVWLLSHGETHRVLIIEAWRIETGGKVLAEGCAHWKAFLDGNWQEVDASAFFDANIQQTERTIASYASHLATLRGFQARVAGG